MIPALLKKNSAAQVEQATCACVITNGIPPSGWIASTLEGMT